MIELWACAVAATVSNPTAASVALGNSVVSAAYYLGVVKTMYFDPAPAASQEAGASRPHLAVGLAIAVAFTILLGVSPSAVLDAAANAMEGVLTGAAG